MAHDAPTALETQPSPLDTFLCGLQTRSMNMGRMRAYSRAPKTSVSTRAGIKQLYGEPKLLP